MNPDPASEYLGSIPTDRSAPRQALETPAAPHTTPGQNSQEPEGPEGPEEPQKHDFSFAVEALLAAGNYSEAAALLGEKYEFILSADRQAELDLLLKRFPEAMIGQHPWLLLARARLHSTAHNTTNAEPLFKEAEARSRSGEDQRAIFASLSQFGNWLSAQSRFTEAIVSYRKAIVFADSDGDRASVLANLALALYMEHGYSSEVEHLMSQALDLAERADLLSTMGRVMRAQAELYCKRGNFAGALAAYSTAEKVMERHFSQKDRVDLLNAVCYIHILCGDLDEAERASHECAHVVAGLLDAEGRAKGGAARADSLLLQGIIALARKLHSRAADLLAQALSLYQELNDRVKIALTFDWLSELARGKGDGDEALRHAEAGLEIRRRLDLSYDVGLSYITLGKALLAIDQHDRARSCMARALEIAYTGDAKYQQAHAHLFLAALECQPEGEASRGFSLHYHANQALQLSRQNGYGWLFASNGVMAVQVLVEALAGGIEAEYAANLLSRAAVEGDHSVLALLNGLSSNPNPAVKRARAAAIRSWGEAPAEPLYVRTLGKFSVTRRGGTVIRWPRSSSRWIFQYLLLHHSRPVPIEELVEVFWPDADLGPARKNLHQAVAGLRHALEPDIPAGFPSRYIQSAYEAYQLVLPPGSTVDNVHFSQQCTHLNTLADLENAARLYTGDFLADNPYADWAIPRRSQFSERFRDILLRLAAAYFDAERLLDCLTTAQRLLEHDPWNEDAVLWLMRVYAARGERTSALRVCKSMQKRLRDDFNIAIRSDIQQLYDELARR